MSQSIHNAALQANASREAARITGRATERAAQRQIEHEKAILEAREARLKECIENFANLDESSLFQMSDKQLAHFQAEHPPESPQYALALNEWNRRLVTRQVNATKYAAIIGLAGVVLGAVLGAVLGWALASI